MPKDLQPRRILAVKLADLGDLLTITPAMQALREAHPRARIDLLAPPSSAHLLQGAPYLDNIVTFDKFPFDTIRGSLDPAQFLNSIRFFRDLRAARYDAILFFHHFPTRWGAFKFGLVSLVSGAAIRVGLDNGRGSFLNIRAADRGFGEAHEADYWLEVAALLGADPSQGWRPYLPISEEHREAAARLLREIRGRHTGPIVALHPGAGAYSPARIWPIEKFAAVGRGLVERGAAIIVLGGDDDRARAARLVSLVGQSDRVLDLAGRTGIHETAAVLEACDLFLGNDSGPMHIAAAMQTPVVAVFGPSNTLAWGPYTPRGQASPHTIVTRGLPCQPCFYRAYSLGLREGCGPRPCLTKLDHRRVLDACSRRLGLAEQSA